MKPKNFVLTAMLMLTGLMSVTHQAQAAGPGGLTCYIYLAGPCHNNLSVMPNRWFADGDPAAHIDGARCMQRATDWYNYCGNPIGALTAYSAINATRPTIGGEVNVIFSFRNIGGAAIYGPTGTVLYLK